MAVQLGVLGDVEARHDGRLVDLGHARQRCVLVALLVEPNRAVPIDQLVDRVWGERPPQRARGAMYSYLSRLRGVLASAGGPHIVRHAGGYLLTADPMTVDMHRFRRLVAQARATDHDLESAARYGSALALWRGDAFATLDTPWVNAVRETLHHERLAAELDRNDLALRGGHHAALLTELSDCAAAHPLDERVAGQFMLALYRSGRQADALALYQRLRLRLADELGTDPGPAVARLYHQVLTADPVLIAPGATSGTPAAGGPPPRPGPGPTPRQLPASPSSFTGRVAELAELDRVLQPGSDATSSVAIAVVTGSGGIGKTWLALRWGHDNLDRFPDGQLYVNLRGFDPTEKPVAPAAAVLGLLQALGAEPGRIPVDPDGQAALYRSLLAGRRILIVVDNARDTASVAPLLPGTATSAVLVTSRHQLVGLVSAHAARPVVLDVMPDTHARVLLTDLVGADRIAAEPGPAALLLRQCNGLPLALGILGARAASQADRPLASLAAELDDVATRLDALDGGELPVNLRAVLGSSVAALSSDAARAFRLLGIAPGPDIRLHAAASLTALPLAHAGALLRELAAGHLIHEHVPGRYRLHDLVRHYAAEQAHTRHAAAELRAARHRMLDHYLHQAYTCDRLLHPHRDPIVVTEPQPGVSLEPINDHAQAMAWLTIECPVLMAAVDHAAEAEFHTHTWQLAWALTTYLDRRARWADQITVHRYGLRAAQRAADRPGQARAHHGLGRIYVRLHRHDDAKDQLLHALEAFAELDDQAGQARIHFDLGWLLERQHDYREALIHDHRALDLYRASGNHSGQANTLHVIGWHHIQLGEYQEGLTYCEQALAVLEEIGERRGQASTWHSIGYAHHHLRDYERGTGCYERALDLLRDLGDRSYEALVLVDLGENHVAAGDRQAAREAWQRGLTILDELGLPEADDVRAKLRHLEQPAATVGGSSP
jgi:DNA-binding SARP family transcriptional activator/tetratricopeptide (TPR) repeat protein